MVEVIVVVDQAESFGPPPPPSRSTSSNLLERPDVGRERPTQRTNGAIQLV